VTRNSRSNVAAIITNYRRTFSGSLLIKQRIPFIFRQRRIRIAGARKRAFLLRHGVASITTVPRALFAAIVNSREASLSISNASADRRTRAKLAAVSTSKFAPTSIHLSEIFSRPATILNVGGRVFFLTEKERERERERERDGKNGRGNAKRARRICGTPRAAARVRYNLFVSMRPNCRLS